jgi:hypothetical protein
MPDDAEVTICQCTDGILIEYEGKFFLSETLSLEEATSQWNGKKIWLIKLRDMTVAMVIWFARSRSAQEVLECVKARAGGSVGWHSYTQLLAMEAAQKLALLRAMGCVDSARTWLIDLESLTKEVSRISQTGHIYANE